MCAKQVNKAQPEVTTTGHVWDGIEELNNPMPKWWVWTFYATIVWGLGYVIAYPAWPMISGATPGVLGYSTRGAVAAEIQRFDDANAENKAALVSADLLAISENSDQLAFATNAGAAVFRTNCAQCHGSGAAGVQGKGYPNLLDNDWLWGGDIEAIHTTVSHGIRNTNDGDARYSEMPRFGADQLLEPEPIAQVVEYVLQLSGQEHDAALAAPGAAIFAEQCSSCHTPVGTGDRAQGAPNLADAIWLYGGTREAITETVTNGRMGVMPSWANRLSEDQIRSVATYVHALGGGE